MVGVRNKLSILPLILEARTIIELMGDFGCPFIDLFLSLVAEKWGAIRGDTPATGDRLVRSPISSKLF